MKLTKTLLRFKYIPAKSIKWHANDKTRQAAFPKADSVARSPVLERGRFIKS